MTTGARAGFPVRLVAAVVDGLVPAVLFWVLWTVLNGGLAYSTATVGGFAYFTLLEGGPSGQTLGKRLVGIRVADAGGGGAIGYGRAAIRYVGRYVSAAVFLLGYLWMLWDRDRQTWHDKLAESVVVTAR